MHAARVVPGGEQSGSAGDGAETGGTLVVVDQFEELFTLCHDPAERAEFIDLLLTGGARVVVAVRADFYGRCAEHRALADALRDATLLVGPMTRAQLREAVVGPATAERLIVERSLTARVVADVADEPGGLPLMAHALREVWRRRRGRTLTVAAYEAVGGVQGAISHTAEEVFTGFTADRARTARALLLRLVAPGDGTQDTRRPVTRAELGTSEETAVVLEQLVAARLLTAGTTTVELAHEALISSWPRLRGWIDEDRERLRLHRRLTDAARMWEELGRDPGALYRGCGWHRRGRRSGPERACPCPAHLIPPGTIRSHLVPPHPIPPSPLSPQLNSPRPISPKLISPRPSGTSSPRASTRTTPPCVRRPAPPAGCAA